MQQNPPKKRQIRLEMPKDPSAIYANTVMISHTASEIIFDFIQIMPNDSRARVQKRLVMTPAHTKLFLRALQENIDKYEDKHGEIKVPQRQSLAEQLFGSVKPGQDEDSDE